MKAHTIDLLSLIVDFLLEIGIKVHFEKIEDSTFLPGIRIRAGGLVIDKEKLLFPGDVLHEAGHIACIASEDRSKLNDDVNPDEPAKSFELGAIAWSYAALIHLNLEPRVVFHENGYKGEASQLIEMFQNYEEPMGLPLLVWMDMTNSPKNEKNREFVYPKMRKWLRS